MDETKVDYCTKCIDDHEDRLRAIERNHTLEVRVEVLEAYMKGEIGLSSQKKESRADTYALIGMLISVCTFVVLIWKLS